MIDWLFGTAWGDISLIEFIFTGVAFFALFPTGRQTGRFSYILWHLHRTHRNGVQRAITTLLLMVASVKLFIFLLCVWGGFLAMERPQSGTTNSSAAITSLVILLIELLLLSVSLYLEHTWWVVIGGRRGNDHLETIPEE